MIPDGRRVKVASVCKQLELSGLGYFAGYVKDCAVDSDDKEFQAIVNLMQHAAERRRYRGSVQGKKVASIRRKLKKIGEEVKNCEDREDGKPFLNLVFGMRCWAADNTGVGTDPLFEQLDRAVGVKSEIAKKK